MGAPRARAGPDDVCPHALHPLRRRLRHLQLPAGQVRHGSCPAGGSLFRQFTGIATAASAYRTPTCPSTPPPPSAAPSSATKRNQAGRSGTPQPPAHLPRHPPPPPPGPRALGRARPSPVRFAQMLLLYAVTLWCFEMIAQVPHLAREVLSKTRDAREALSTARSGASRRSPRSFALCPRSWRSAIKNVPKKQEKCCQDKPHALVLRDDRPGPRGRACRNVRACRKVESHLRATLRIATKQRGQRGDFQAA